MSSEALSIEPSLLALEQLQPEISSNDWPPYTLKSISQFIWEGATDVSYYGWSYEYLLSVLLPIFMVCDPAQKEDSCNDTIDNIVTYVGLAVVLTDIWIKLLRYLCLSKNNFNMFNRFESLWYGFQSIVWRTAFFSSLFAFLMTCVDYVIKDFSESDAGQLLYVAGALPLAVLFGFGAQVSLIEGIRQSLCGGNPEIGIKTKRLYTICDALDGGAMSYGALTSIISTPEVLWKIATGKDIELAYSNEGTIARLLAIPVGAIIFGYLSSRYLYASSDKENFYNTWYEKISKTFYSICFLPFILGHFFRQSYAVPVIYSMFAYSFLVLAFLNKFRPNAAENPGNTSTVNIEEITDNNEPKAAPLLAVAGKKQGENIKAIGIHQHREGVPVKEFTLPNDFDFNKNEDSKSMLEIPSQRKAELK